MKENKEPRKSNLTPEQERKYHKISLAGSIILGLLLIALVGSVLGVYLSNKTKQEKPYINPFEKVGLLSLTDFKYTLDKKTFNDTTYHTVVTTKSEDKKKEDSRETKDWKIDAKVINKIYIMFHTDNIDGKLKEKVQSLNNEELIKNGILFLTVSIDHEYNNEQSSNVKETIKKFVDEFTHFDLANEEKKKIFDDEKLFFIEIDVQNFENRNHNKFIQSTKEENIIAKITKVITEDIQK